MVVLPNLELLPPRSAGLPCHEVWIIEWIIFWVTDRHRGSGDCILRLSTLFDKFRQRWNSLRPARWHCTPYGSLGLYQHLWEKMFWWRWKYNTSSCSVESTEGQVPGSWIWSLICRNLLEECWSQQTFSLRFWACCGTPVQIFEDFGFGTWPGHSNIFRISPDITNNVLNDRAPFTRYLCAFKVAFMYVLCRQYRVDIFIQNIYKFARYVMKYLILSFSNTCTWMCLPL